MKTGQYVKKKDARRQKSDNRRWEEERRCVKTKETMHKCLKSPNICTFNTINTVNIKLNIANRKTMVKRSIGYAMLRANLVQYQAI